MKTIIPWRPKTSVSQTAKMFICKRIPYYTRNSEKLQPPMSGFLWFFISLFQKKLNFFTKLPKAWEFQPLFGGRVKNFPVVLFFLFNSSIIKGIKKS